MQTVQTTDTHTIFVIGDPPPWTRPQCSICGTRGERSDYRCIKVSDQPKSFVCTACAKTLVSAELLAELRRQNDAILRQNYPEEFTDKADQALMKKIREANDWANLRHQNRCTGTGDHNRYETDRLSQILEACRESESPWGYLIQSAIPACCRQAIDILAGILAKQRATPYRRCTDDPCPYLDRDKSEYIRYLEESQSCISACLAAAKARLAKREMPSE